MSRKCTSSISLKVKLSNLLKHSQNKSICITVIAVSHHINGRCLGNSGCQAESMFIKELSWSLRKSGGI